MMDNLEKYSADRQDGAAPPPQKTRKPYTMTKQREKWTDDEHQKFVEALRLYGRQWRKIEEHIGTKTSVQIRSHAQKFFSKVQKQQKQLKQGIPATSNAATDVPLDIEIPPPRLKRRNKQSHHDGSNTATNTVFHPGLPPLPNYAATVRMASSGAEGAPNVHDVAMAAVTAAASAAAAAAAAAVVAAAGRDIEARIQAAPPNGFPFYGMPPSLLRSMSANPPLNQLNAQGQATRDNPRGKVGGHREAGAEATGTSEPGRQHHPAQVHGEDGEDSACSRENEDGAGQLKETTSDGKLDDANNNNNLGNISDFTRQLQHSGGSNLAARFLANPLSSTYIPPPTSMWGPQYSDPGSMAAAAQLWSMQPASQEGLPGPLTFQGATTTTIHNNNNNNNERTIASLPPKPLSKSRQPNGADNNKHQAELQRDKEAHSNGGNNGGGSGGSTADDGRSKLPRGQQPGSNTNVAAHVETRAGNETDMPEYSGSNPTGNGNGNGGSSGNDSIHPNGNGNGHSSKMQPLHGAAAVPKPSNGNGNSSGQHGTNNGTGNGSSGRGSNEGANTNGNGSGQNPTNGNGSAQNPNGSGTGHYHHHHHHHRHHHKHHHKHHHHNNSIDNNTVTNNNHDSNNGGGDGSNGNGTNGNGTTNGTTNGNGVNSKIRPLPPPPPPRTNGNNGQGSGDKNSGEDGGTGGSGEKGSGGDKAGSGDKNSGGNGSGGNGSGGNHSAADGARMGQSRRKTSPQEPASGVVHQAGDTMGAGRMDRERGGRAAQRDDDDDDDDDKQDCQSDSPSNKQMTGTSQGADALQQVVHVHAVQAAMHAIQSSGLHNLMSMQQPYAASALAPWAHTGASLGLETFKAYQIASMSTEGAVSAGHMQTAAVAAAATQGMINPMSFATTFALNTTTSAPVPSCHGREQQGGGGNNNGNGGSGSAGGTSGTRRPPLSHQRGGSGSGGSGGNNNGSGGNGAKSTSPSSQEKSGKPNTTSGSDDAEDDANAGRRSSKRKASSSRLGGRKKSKPIPSDDQ